MPISVQWTPILLVALALFALLCVSMGLRPLPRESSVRADEPMSVWAGAMRSRLDVAALPTLCIYDNRDGVLLTTKRLTQGFVFTLGYTQATIAYASILEWQGWVGESDGHWHHHNVVIAYYAAKEDAERGHELLARYMTNGGDYALRSTAHYRRVMGLPEYGGLCADDSVFPEEVRFLWPQPRVVSSNAG